MEKKYFKLVKEVLKNYFDNELEELKWLSLGRIHLTFYIKNKKGKYILQRISPVFQNSEALGKNWHKVYNRAVENNISLKMPKIYLNKNNSFLTKIKSDEAHWRLIEYIEGERPQKNIKAAETAAKILALFHCALNKPQPLNLDKLPNGNFTNHYLSTEKDLQIICEKFKDNKNLSSLKFLLEKASCLASFLSADNIFKEKFAEKNIIIHGDPKLDNFLSSPNGEVIALFDWDTVGLSNVLVELAEFCRSWAYKAETNVFNSELALIALNSYQSLGLKLSEDDLKVLPKTTIAVALNLARRYLTDALAESYFNLEDGFTSLYEQNKLRAEQMLSLGQILKEKEQYLINLFLAETKLTNNFR